MQRQAAQTTEQPGDSTRRMLVIEPPEGSAYALDPKSARDELVIVLPEGATDAPDPASTSAEMVIELPEYGADAPDPASASAKISRSLSRPPTRLTAGRWAAGAAALAVLAVLGYQIHKMASSVDVPFEKARLSAAASAGVTERRGPGASGTFGQDAIAGGASVAKMDQGIAPPAGDASVAKIIQGIAPLAAPVSTSKAPPGEAARAPAEPRRASRRAAAAHPPREQELPRAEPCTAAIAAVGLCSPGLEPAAKTKAAAKAGSAIAPPQADIPRKPVERAQPRAAPCTEQVAALGLCTADSMQGKE